MYSTAKRLAGISAIACALNIFGIIIFAMALPSLEIKNFALILGIYLFMITSAIICLMVTLGMRSMCQDLSYDFESQAKKFHDYNERIKNLENKM